MSAPLAVPDGSGPRVRGPEIASPPTASLPAWVEQMVDGASVVPLRGRGGRPDVRRRDAGGWRQISTAVANVRALDVLTFQQAVMDAFAAVFDQLGPAGAVHPVRFWAFVPDIHAQLEPDLDRYMVFNAARFAAYSAWYGGREAFPRTLPTASAVGTSGADLVLHCLAADAPGQPVENPRQVPAYRYSRRFGPLPPCFARATVVRPRAGAPLLMVGGTASIRGEESMHEADLAAQVDETLANLASVVSAAWGGLVEGRAALTHYRHLRAYHRREGDRGEVESRMKAAFPGLERLELLSAELCRPELLVEVEGLAEGTPAPSSPT
jgi:chorismate lyase / 3-hydroxybenzoate synthase